MIRSQFQFLTVALCAAALVGCQSMSKNSDAAGTQTAAATPPAPPSIDDIVNRAMPSADRDVAAVKIYRMDCKIARPGAPLVAIVMNKKGDVFLEVKPLRGDAVMVDLDGLSGDEGYTQMIIHQKQKSPKAVAAGKSLGIKYIYISYDRIDFGNYFRRGDTGRLTYDNTDIYTCGPAK